MHIDLNCDMGESFGHYTLGNDAAMLDIVTSANIACGMHAGDPTVMTSTVQLAAQKGVSIGAHPGYPDLQGFGRRTIAMMPDDVAAYVLYQIGALAGFAQAASVKLNHVKPHGALYNNAAVNSELAQAIAQAVADFDPNLTLVTLPGSVMALAARSVGLNVAGEGFADRAYNDDGTLVARSQPGAVIHDPQQAAARAVRMVTQQEVETISGHVIPLPISTLCIHGDTPGAPQIAADLRDALETAGVDVRPLNL